MGYDYSGQTAIVTGAGRGIGRELAYQFADAGANVVAAARTSNEIEQTVEEVEARGASGLAVPTDLVDLHDVDRLVAAASDEFGAPTVLVNNAGAHLAGGPLARTEAELDTMVGVNFKGLFFLSQRFANELIDAGAPGGRIVNVSSIVGHLTVPAMIVYAGTKAGVYGLTRGLAGELAQYDITVNSVSPGLTRVERIERLLEEKGELYNPDTIPMGRLATPEDIADAVLFLASDRASYITGVDLPVDGGAVITAALYRDQYVSRQSGR